MNIKLLKFSLFFILLSFSQAVFGDSLLENQERETAQSISNANFVSQYYAHYKAARTEYFYGSAGLQKKSELYLKNIQDWIQNGFQLLAYLNLDSAAEVNLSAIEAKASVLLTEQVRSLANIIALGNEIEVQSAAALKVLGNANDLDTSLIPSAKATLQKVLEARNQLKQSIEELRKLPISSTPKLREAMGLTKQGSMAKLKLRLIDRGLRSLLPSVVAVENLLSAQEIIEPKLSEIAFMEQSANESLLFTRAFHLKTIANKSKVECDSVQDLILSQKGRVGDDFVQNYLSRAKLLCGNIESYQAQIDSVSRNKSQLILNYLKSLTPLAKRKCTSLPSPVYCEKFAILAGIPAENYNTFSDSRLEFIESELRAIQPLMK